MVIGTRRRLGGVVDVEDDAGGGEEAERSIGTDRCGCDLSETLRRERGKREVRIEQNVLPFPSCSR